MARDAAITVENNFTRGLVTEFTAMNFPENAVTEGDNCVYSELGKVTRRFGMNYEGSNTTYAMSSLSTLPNCFTEFEWYSAGGQGTTVFVVQQVGDTLHFFTVSTTGALSSSKKSFTVSLQAFKASGASNDLVSSLPCQYTVGKGYLVVTHPLCDPFYISYDQDTDTITTTRVTLEIRDFERIADGLEIDERPTTLTNTHRYNLYNQGWYVSADDEDDNGPVPVINEFRDQVGVYPSNADVWWSFKNAEDNFDPDETAGVINNTPAPNGHFIYNALSINRTSESGISGLPSQNSGTARPSAIAFFAGRAFYAGVLANKYSDKIYFTQIIESDDQFGKCYQSNDPTSEAGGDLLDSDGGVISLPLIKSVLALKVIRDVLVVVGSNAVYIIRGTDNGPFKATDYTVEYVSSIGGLSHLSVVAVDDGLIWWNADAIYAIAPSENGLSFSVTNISKSTIQTLFNSVPSENRQFIKGSYNKKEQKAQWVFSDSESITNYQYNRILEFNVISKAFYPHTIDTTLGPRLSGILAISGLREQLTSENVLNNSLTLVTTNALAPVTINSSKFIPDSELFKYLTTGNISLGSSGLTYSEMSDPDYVDWQTVNSVGVQFSSYGYSGYRVRGDFLKKFQSTPILFVLENVAGAQINVSAVWDYGARQSTVQQLYRDQGDVSYVLRRVKLRGKGRSLQIKFESVSDDPFSLVGWSTFDSGGQLP